MRSRAGLVSLTVVVLAFAGCGSTKKAATTTPASSVAAPTTSTATSVTHSVNLAGANQVPAGAPNGSGLAVISINASSNELCWEFSQLKNVTAPTKAEIRLPVPSRTIRIPLGGAYKATGCSYEPPIVLGPLEANPQSFYVNIQNAKYPEGAVQGQL